MHAFTTMTVDMHSENLERERERESERERERERETSDIQEFKLDTTTVKFAMYRLGCELFTMM